jgi:hypothetical protein
VRSGYEHCIEKQFFSAYTVQYFNTTPTFPTQRLHYEDLPLTIFAPKNAHAASQVAGFSSRMVHDVRQPMSASFVQPYCISSFVVFL